MAHEKKSRSLLKALSWRFFATVTTITVVFIFTGELVLAAGIGLLELVAKLLLYYLHERFWDRFHWGRSDKEVNDNVE